MAHIGSINYVPQWSSYRSNWLIGGSFSLSENSPSPIYMVQVYPATSSFQCALEWAEVYEGPGFSGTGQLTAKLGMDMTQPSMTIPMNTLATFLTYWQAHAGEYGTQTTYVQTWDNSYPGTFTGALPIPTYTGTVIQDGNNVTLITDAQSQIANVKITPSPLYYSGPELDMAAGSTISFDLDSVPDVLSIATRTMGTLYGRYDPSSDPGTYISWFSFDVPLAPEPVTPGGEVGYQVGVETMFAPTRKRRDPSGDYANQMG